VKTLRT